MPRSVDASVEPDESTDLYDVRRLAALLQVKPATIRSLRLRHRLPEPTSTDINGGAVWHRTVVESFFRQPMPAFTTADAVTESINPQLPPVIDLFCGCGGMALGFRSAGFEVQRGFDNWLSAIETYTANLDHKAQLLDLSNLELTIEHLKEFHVEGTFPAVIGGPPCQDFSSAGHRIEGARADLTEKFAAIIEHFQPPFFVMENVPRAETAGAFHRAVSIMRSAGYTVERVVLDAAHCGVPQRRKRLITVGSLEPGIVQKAHDWMLSNQTKRAMTIRDWFGDRLGTDFYYRHPRSYARRAIFSIDEPSPTIRGVNRPIPNGYPGHPGDMAPVSEARPLTTLERAEIQTFPLGYKWMGSKTDTEQMIGNAVPVRMAQFIASAISSAILV